MNTEYQITIVLDDQVAAEVGPLREQAADELAVVLDRLDVEYYRYTRPGEFGAWRFAS